MQGVVGDFYTKGPAITPLSPLSGGLRGVPIVNVLRAQLQYT